MTGPVIQNAFLRWLDEAFSDENGKGSNHRIGQFMALASLLTVFIFSSVMLIHRGVYGPFTELFYAITGLAAALYGVSKVMGSREKVAEIKSQAAVSTQATVTPAGSQSSTQATGAGAATP